MKILFHHRIASRDGQAVHMDELCAALRKLGHTVILVGPARTARLEFGGDAGMIAWLKRILPQALYETLELLYNFAALPRLWWAVHPRERCVPLPRALRCAHCARPSPEPAISTGTCRPRLRSRT